jgi:hypothetical protein
MNMQKILDSVENYEKKSSMCINVIELSSNSIYCEVHIRVKQILIFRFLKTFLVFIILL